MTINALSAKIPPELVKQREQGGATLNYIEWSTVVKRFNEICHNDWNFKVVDHTDDGEEACVWGALTVEGTTRENMGFEDNCKFWKTPGSRYKSAVSDCIKRCAAMFGMGLELYHDLPETTMPDVMDPAQRLVVMDLCSRLAKMGEDDKASQMVDYIDNTPELTSKGAEKAIERLEQTIADVEGKQAEEKDNA